MSIKAKVYSLIGTAILMVSGVGIVAVSSLPALNNVTKDMYGNQLAPLSLGGEANQHAIYIKWSTAGQAARFRARGRCR